MDDQDLFPPDPAVRPRAKRSVFVKELCERDRRRIRRHFLGLTKEDRLLRFGTYASDELIEQYVAKLDFERDKIFGVVSAHFRLVGVGHLAFAAHNGNSSVTNKTQVAEFGVSVSPNARGKGIGSKLFERGAIHCRNADVDTLYMHCLSTNRTMMHIAQKAGMAIERDHGEADAYLKLIPRNSVTLMREALQEQIATLDYALKANARAAMKWVQGDY
jgi:GNAT superfamily N-acetyltransferase